MEVLENADYSPTPLEIFYAWQLTNLREAQERNLKQQAKRSKYVAIANWNTLQTRISLSIAQKSKLSLLDNFIRKNFLQLISIIIQNNLYEGKECSYLLKLFQHTNLNPTKYNRKIYQTYATLILNACEYIFSPDNQEIQSTLEELIFLDRSIDKRVKVVIQE